MGARIDAKIKANGVAEFTLTVIIFNRGGNRNYGAISDTFAVLNLVYTEDPIVSSDIVTSSASCTFDALLTKSMGDFVKVMGWYDNEWGYSCRMVDLTATRFARPSSFFGRKNRLMSSR